MIIPITLINNFKWEMSDLWQVYLPAMIFGIVAMGPASIFAEKKGKFREILLAGIILFAISYLIIGFSSNSTIFVIGVVVFFIGFNMHEPIMQSLASKFAKVHQRGLVLGIFTSAGYVGTFLGGLVGGAFYESASMGTLVVVIAIVCILWAILIITMPNPEKKKFIYLSLNEFHLENSGKLNHNAI